MSDEVTEARRVLIKLGRTPEYLDALTVFVRAVVAESRPQPSAPERPAPQIYPRGDTSMHFRCRAHGAHVATRDGGKCVKCGADCFVEPCVLKEMRGEPESPAEKRSSATSERTHGEAKEAEASALHLRVGQGEPERASSVRGAGEARGPVSARVAQENGVAGNEDTADVARTSSGGVPDPNPTTLIELHDILHWLAREGWQPIVAPEHKGAILHIAGRSWQVSEHGVIRAVRGDLGYQVVVLSGLQRGLATLPSVPPAPLTGNDGTGGQQAGSGPGEYLTKEEDARLLALVRRVTRKDVILVRDWHLAFDAFFLGKSAGRASLAKRNLTAVERFIAWLEVAKPLGAIGLQKVEELRRELRKGA